MWYVIGGVVIFAAGAGFGVIYKERKLKPIIAVLQNSTLTAEEKVKKIIDLLL